MRTSQFVAGSIGAYWGFSKEVMEFKVGDKVKVLKERNYYWCGVVSIVTDVHPHGIIIDHPKNGSGGFDKEDLEKASPLEELL